MQDGVVAHVHGNLAAFFNDTAVRHIAAGGEASAEVEDVADLHVLEVIGGNIILLSNFDNGKPLDGYDLINLVVTAFKNSLQFLNC